jgi:hypothetical protein
MNFVVTLSPIEHQYFIEHSPLHKDHYCNSHWKLRIFIDAVEFFNLPFFSTTFLITNGRHRLLLLLSSVQWKKAGSMRIDNETLSLWLRATPTFLLSFTMVIFTSLHPIWIHLPTDVSIRTIISRKLMQR